MRFFALGWPPGTLAAIYITLRRYLPIRPQPRLTELMLHSNVTLSAGLAYRGGKRPVENRKDRARAVSNGSCDGPFVTAPSNHKPKWQLESARHGVVVAGVRHWGGVAISDLNDGRAGSTVDHVQECAACEIE